MHSHARNARPAPGRVDPGVAPELAARRISTVIGRLGLVTTDVGLAYIAFESEDLGSVLQRLSLALGARPVEADPGPVPAGHLDLAADQIGAYLGGSRREFDLPLDTGAVTGFRGRVQRALADIGYGTTVGYAELAARLGNPGAARAVGSACASNPLPLVWPCHRVLRSDGGLGGYRGGLPLKRHLLEMEDASLGDEDMGRRQL